jgi:hypothetical protein
MEGKKAQVGLTKSTIKDTTKMGWWGRWIVELRTFKTQLGVKKH